MHLREKAINLSFFLSSFFLFVFINISLPLSREVLLPGTFPGPQVLEDLRLEGIRMGVGTFPTLSSRIWRAVLCVGLQGRSGSGGSGLREDCVRSFWKEKKY